MNNYLASSLNFINQRRRVDQEKIVDTRPISANKWSQYQVDRWFRSVSTSHAKPKLHSQICGTFVPNLPSHQSAEKMANREAK